jgi:uncharacterized protein YukE
MSGGLGDLRFEGFSNEQLAGEIDGLRNGAGSESLHRAVHALMSIADALADTDRTLRQELRRIGVEWEGAAAEQGQEQTQQASIYAEDAVPVVARSASGVNEQGDSFSHSRNSAPNSETLRGPSQLNGVDRFAGMFGHTTDNAKKVQETQAARGQAIGSLDDYQRGSQSALDNHQNLPVPPGMDLVSRPTDPHGMTAAQGFQGNQGAYTPGGGAGGPTTAGPVGIGNGQGHLGYTGVNTPGGPGQVPGGGQSSPLPGRVAGIGPVPGVPGMPIGGGAGFTPRPFPFGLVADMGALAGVAGATAGGAAAGAALPKDKLVRGGAGGASAGGADGKAAGKAAVDGPDARARGAAALAGAPDEQARAARAAERLGGGAGKTGSSLMSPAAGSAPGEDDDEHVRKYGIDSDDVFADERLVIDAVLGGEDDAGR